MTHHTPLAERVRPLSLETYIGQQHIIGKEGVLYNAISHDNLPSLIFWGPPGVGKTSLALLIAKQLDRQLHVLSAVSAGVKDVRDILNSVEKGGLFSEKRPILFIDEIHRFSKSQQDSLLNAVEKGIITLIGATTENPSFEVISALLSRCQVYTLKHLTKSELTQLLENTIKNDSILSAKKIILTETDALIQLSGGDARKLLNLFELLIQLSPDTTIEITNEFVHKNTASAISAYDKNGENHYDIASAMIKSIRGSDVNAAVYWLARMIAGGEDPSFIARRLLISASEDIGIANPTALILANNTFQAINTIGFPEAKIILSQCVIYLASSPKGNSAYQAINKALETVHKSGNLSVPLHLRNAPTQLMKELGYGEGYLNAHSFEGGFTQQEFMPLGLENMNFIVPGSSKKEQELNQQIVQLWGEKYPL